MRDLRRHTWQAQLQAACPQYCCSKYQQPVEHWRVCLHASTALSLPSLPPGNACLGSGGAHFRLAYSSTLMSSGD